MKLKRVCKQYNIKCTLEEEVIAESYDSGEKEANEEEENTAGAPG